PGDETITVIGASESASSASNLRTVSAASASVTVPNIRTVLERNAFSSRKVLSRSDEGPGCVSICCANIYYRSLVLIHLVDERTGVCVTYPDDSAFSTD